MSDDIEIQIITPEVADETDPVEFGLISLVEAISQIDPERVSHGLLGGEFGYGAKFENDVFSMQPDYQDAECDCGFSEQADQWHAKNQHLESCYYELRRKRIDEWKVANNYDAIDKASHCDIFVINGRRFKGSADEAWRAHFSEGGEFESRRSKKAEKAFEAWRALHNRLDKAEDEISKTLCKELGIPWNKGYGSAVHCTCGVDERAKVYFTEHDHARVCALVLPNFRHKASGFEARWYKWIGRDMEVTGLSGVNIAAIFAECVASLKQEKRPSI